MSCRGGRFHRATKTKEHRLAAAVLAHFVAANAVFGEVFYMFNT